MPSNPYFPLQLRAAALIAAHPYFATVNPANQILTEQVGNLEFKVLNNLLPLGFGIVVTTAMGKSTENSYNALLSDEDLNVTIIHNPTTDPNHDALDAQWAIMEALQGQSIQDPPPPDPTEKDFFRIGAHQRRLDAPPELNVREVHVLAFLRLL